MPAVVGYKGDEAVIPSLAVLVTGIKMLKAVMGSVNRCVWSRTFHSKTAFTDGRDAQTRKGFVGTGAKDVQTAADRNVGAEREAGAVE